MNIIIKPLTSDIKNDYFDFFENRAFTDDSPHRCYCQMYQITKEQNEAFIKEVLEDADESFDAQQASKDAAAKQIDSSRLRGYLAFVDGVAIGWCNTNDKANYPIEPCIGESFYVPVEDREKAVICFEIAPEYRRKGVATALLRRVIDDATTDGYSAVEGFPVVRDERYEWDWTGPLRLYEKLGFVNVATRENNVVVMRKELL